MKRIKIPFSILLSILMISAVIFSISAEAAVNNNEVLQKIAKQSHDKSNYAFDFRVGKGEKSKYPTGSIGGDKYPESFDLRNVDTDGDGKGDTSYVTPVKFQNPFGSCWAFAAISAAETSILGNPKLYDESLNKDTMDLSEKHLAWFSNEPISDKDDPQYGEGGVFGNGIGDIDPTRLDSGGLPIHATSLFSSGTGPVFEHSKNPEISALVGDSFEYHGKNKEIIYADDGTPYSYSAEDDWSIDNSFRFMQSYRLKETYQLPSPAKVSDHFKSSAIGAMKEQLMQKRAIEIGFTADSSQPSSPDGETEETLFISDKWAHYTFDPSAEVTHAVTVVGWDDNYPKENFTHKIGTVIDQNDEEVDVDDETAAKLTTPKQNGAWLVKNSWGAGTEEFPNRGSGNWGIPVEGKDKDGKPAMVGSGYFWISYEDKSISYVEALEFDTLNDKDYYVYEHDFMPVNYTHSAAISEKLSTSNIFTADDTVNINEVTCQTTTPNTRVHYDLYLLNDNFKTPTDGKKLYETDVKYAWGGFHRQDLDKDAVIKKGKKFSVVVTQQASDDMYMFNTYYGANFHYADENALMSYSKGVINKGESMFCVGGQWLDISNQWVKDLIMAEDSYYCDMDNFPIKAYGDKVDEPVKKVNPLKVSAKTVNFKASKLKSKSQSAKPVTVKNAKGKVTYAKVKSGSSSKIYSKITVNKTTGKITLKKGKYAKKTYTVAVKVNAAGNDDFKSGSKTVKVKIKVK